VPNGEGVATEKFDGTSCMIRDGHLFKRYDAKPGRTPPDGFEMSGEPDPVTGRVQGWVPVRDGPEDRRHREAFDALTRVADYELLGPTWELVGPKVQGNPHKLSAHRLVPHGTDELPDAPRTFDGIRAYLEANEIEGIVWHHSDGRMVKIKARDFGIDWPRK
jgi:hypothetical protein